MSDTESARVAEVDPGGLILLRGRSVDAQFRAAAESVLGMPLPSGPQRPSRGADRVVFWTAPDAFLLRSPGRDASVLLAALQERLAGADAVVLDVSDARAIVSVSGPAAADVLAQGTGVDLDDDRFESGSAALTLFAGLAVLLDRPGHGPYYEIYHERPAQRWLGAWLDEALRGLAQPAAAR
jgi:sarcosine oxidase subunit gamma